MLMDRFIPEYEFQEVHSIRVSAPPSRVFQAIRDVEPSEIPGFRILFRLRAMPAWLEGRHVPFQGSEPVFLQALRSGFVPLAEEIDRELVVGWIGQFWKLRGGFLPRIGGPEDFRAFDRPGFAKAALNFLAVRRDDFVEVRTETRVHATDPYARAMFATYWGLISTGSGYTRVMWLRAIRRRAEREL